MPENAILESKKAPNSRRETAAGVFLVSLGIFCLVLANHPTLLSRLMNSAGPFEEIAKLSKESGAVRYKRSRSIIWNDSISNTESLGSGDSVFTDEASNAAITMKTGEGIALGPNTLIIVRAKSPLDVVQGSVQVTLKDESNTLRFKAMGQVYELKSRAGRAKVELAVEKSQGRTKLRLKSLEGARVTVRKSLTEAPPEELQSGKDVTLKTEEPLVKKVEPPKPPEPPRTPAAEPPAPPEPPKPAPKPKIVAKPRPQPPRLRPKPPEPKPEPPKTPVDGDTPVLYPF